jgi:hypothetical protein
VGKGGSCTDPTRPPDLASDRRRPPQTSGHKSSPLQRGSDGHGWRSAPNEPSHERWAGRHPLDSCRPGMGNGFRAPVVGSNPLAQQRPQRVIGDLPAMARAIRTVVCRSPRGWLRPAGLRGWPSCGSNRAATTPAPLPMGRRWANAGWWPVVAGTAGWGVSVGSSCIRW